MGDFKGHATPGTMFFFYGLWWAILALRRHFTCRRSGGKFVSTSSYSSGCSLGRLGVLPLEGVLKIGLSGFGMFAELILNLPHPNMGIIQHATMYFFFLLSGCVDVCMHYGVQLPHGMDYGATALAFTVEGLLFANHLHGRSEVDVQIHTLLVYVIFLTVIVLLLEIRLQNLAILSLIRAYLTMLQGTWFWAVGVILYAHGSPNTAWDGSKPMEVMQATIYFSWHCAFLFVLILLLTMAMSKCYRGAGGNYGSDLPMTLRDKGNTSGTSNGGNGYKPLTTGFHDEDSDIEFERPIGKD